MHIMTGYNWQLLFLTLFILISLGFYTYILVIHPKAREHLAEYLSKDETSYCYC